MISSVIVDILRADIYIAARLTSFNGKPSVFTDVVPEGVSFPCITVRSMQINIVNGTIQNFNVYVDFWDYNKIDSSREKGKEVAARVEELLDGYRYIGPHSRYSDIRFRYLSGYSATADEYDGIHYNCFIGARACRKKWLDALDVTTTEISTTTEMPTTTE
jgi:hypothetical protein